LSRRQKSAMFSILRWVLGTLGLVVWIFVMTLGVLLALTLVKF